MGNATKLWEVGLLGVFVVACASHSHDGEELYVMGEYYEHDAEYGGGPFGGCTMAVYEDDEVGESKLAGGLPGLENDFVLEDYTEGDGLLVTVSSQDEILETRDYDIGFVRSGEVDRFQITTHAGRVFDLAYWGGSRCDTSRHVIKVPDATPDRALEQ